MEREGSPYLQVHTTCPYPESDQSILCPPSHFLNIPLNIILLFQNYYPPPYAWTFKVDILDTRGCKK